MDSCTVVYPTPTASEKTITWALAPANITIPLNPVLSSPIVNKMCTSSSLQNSSIACPPEICTAPCSACSGPDLVAMGNTPDAGSNPVTVSNITVQPKCKDATGKCYKAQTDGTCTTSTSNPQSCCIRGQGAPPEKCELLTSAQLNTRLTDAGIAVTGLDRAALLVKCKQLALSTAVSSPDYAAIATRMQATQATNIANVTAADILTKSALNTQMEKSINQANSNNAKGTAGILAACLSPLVLIPPLPLACVPLAASTAIYGLMEGNIGSKTLATSKIADFSASTNPLSGALSANIIDTTTQKIQFDENTSNIQKNGYPWAFIGQNHNTSWSPEESYEPSIYLQADRVANKHLNLSYDNANPRIRGMIGRYNEIAAISNGDYGLKKCKVNTDGTEECTATAEGVGEGNSRFTNYFPSIGYVGSDPEISIKNGAWNKFACIFGGAECVKSPGADAAMSEYIKNNQCMPGFSRVSQDALKPAAGALPGSPTLLPVDSDGDPTWMTTDGTKATVVGKDWITKLTDSIAPAGSKKTQQISKGIQFGRPVCIKDRLGPSNYMYCSNNQKAGDTFASIDDIRQTNISPQFSSASAISSIPELGANSLWVYPLKEPGVCLPAVATSAFTPGCAALKNRDQCRAGTSRILDPQTLGNNVPGVLGTNTASALAISSPYKGANGVSGDGAEPRMAPGGSTYPQCKWQPSDQINYTLKLQSCAITDRRFVPTPNWGAMKKPGQAMSWPPSDTVPKISQNTIFGQLNDAQSADPGSCPVFSGDQGAWNYMKNWCIGSPDKWNDACLLPEVWAKDFDQYNDISADGGCDLGWRTQDSQGGAKEKCNGKPIDGQCTGNRYKWCNIRSVKDAPTNADRLGQIDAQAVRQNFEQHWIASCSANPLSKMCNYVTNGNSPAFDENTPTAGFWKSPSYLFPANQPIDSGQKLSSIKNAVEIYSLNPPQLRVTMTDGTKKIVTIQFINGIDHSIWSTWAAPNTVANGQFNVPSLTIINAPNQTKSKRFSGQWESPPWQEQSPGKVAGFNESFLYKLTSNTAETTGTCGTLDGAEGTGYPQLVDHLGPTSTVPDLSADVKPATQTAPNRTDRATDDPTTKLGDLDPTAAYKKLGDDGNLCDPNLGGINLMPGLRTEPGYVVVLVNPNSQVGGVYTEEIMIRNIQTFDSFQIQDFQNAAKRIEDTIYNTSACGASACLITAANPLPATVALAKPVGQLANATLAAYIGSLTPGFDNFSINRKGVGTLAMQACHWAATNSPSTSGTLTAAQSAANSKAEGWDTLKDVCGNTDAGGGKPLGKIALTCAGITEENVGNKFNFGLVAVTQKLKAAIAAAKTTNNICLTAPESESCQKTIQENAGVIAAQHDFDIKKDSTDSIADLRATCGCYMNPSIYTYQAASLSDLGINTTTDAGSRHCFSPQCMAATSIARTGTWSVPGAMPEMQPSGKNVATAVCNGPSCINVAKVDIKGSINESSISFNQVCSINGNPEGNKFGDGYQCKWDSDCDIITASVKSTDDAFPYTFKCVSEEQPTGGNRNVDAAGTQVKKTCRATCVDTTGTTDNITGCSNLTVGTSGPNQPGAASTGACQPVWCGCKDFCAGLSCEANTGTSSPADCRQCVINNNTKAPPNASKTCLNKTSILYGGSGTGKKMWNNPKDGTSQNAYYFLPKTVCTTDTDCYGTQTCNGGKCGIQWFKCNPTTAACDSVAMGTTGSLPGVGNCQATCSLNFCNYGGGPSTYIGKFGEGSAGNPQLVFHGPRDQGDPSIPITSGMVAYYNQSRDSGQGNESWDNMRDVGNINAASYSTSHILRPSTTRLYVADFSPPPLEVQYVGNYGFDSGGSPSLPWFSVKFYDSATTETTRYFQNLPVPSTWPKGSTSASDQASVCLNPETLTTAGGGLSTGAKIGIIAGSVVAVAAIVVGSLYAAGVIGAGAGAGAAGAGAGAGAGAAAAGAVPIPAFDTAAMKFLSKAIKKTKKLRR